MNISIKSALYLSLALLLSGCGASLELSDYTKANLKNTQYMPTPSEVEIKKPKIIVMSLNNNNIKLAQNAKLGSSMATRVKTLFSRSKSVEVVQRANSKVSEDQISKEVEAAELSRELQTDVGSADFLIKGELSNASYTHTFSEGYYYDYKDSKGKVRTAYVPPRMYYESCVMGNLQVLSLPELKEQDSFSFYRCARNSTEVRNSRDVKRDPALLREAGTRAIDTLTIKLKNFFSTKGYIYEMRNNDDDLIVKTTFGREHGAMKGEDVDIFTIIDDTNPLTKKTQRVTMKIGEGVVSDQITGKYSWVIVDELNEQNTIKAGDFVKAKYSSGFFNLF
ncbi:MAG: hypothetical protein GQ570_08900 [Helicobacteraceae bacterium]|nr:hypothetical protein [Helicobacteraceae bacterium]